MFSKLFWRDASERAISTAAQAVLLAIGASDSVFGFLNQEVNVGLILYAAIGGFTLSILKALAALHITEGNSASLSVDNVKQK